MTIQTDDTKLVEEILKAVRTVSYGHVQIVIQDSRVVQIETLEKKRLTK
jgi:hypothetical protein